MSVTVMTGNSIVDSMAPGWKPEKDRLGLYSFTVRCFVIRARPPRHPYFDLTREMGSGLIDKVFRNGDISRGRKDVDLAFFFPERHMSVHEQREFMNALAKHKDVSNIAHVDLVTSSPIMISDFPAEQVRIINWPEDHGVYPGA